MDEISTLLGNLPQVSFFILIVIFALIVFQEAVNGFHDVANAVATVIYSNSLSPRSAVVMAALFNFIGVVIGGTAVAFGMVFLLPKEMVAGINTAHEASLMLALVITAVAWNFGTWWLAIPNSTTHTYIGSIIGVSMAHAFIAGQPVADQINWGQGEKVLLTLLISPIIGFVLGWILLKLTRAFVKDEEMFAPHQPGVKPSKGIRYSLIGGAAGVSLLHGSNDGQKSIGLMMMVLMGLAPGLYAINPASDQQTYIDTMAAIEETMDVVEELQDNPNIPSAHKVVVELADVKELAMRSHDDNPLTEEEEIRMRAEILDLREEILQTVRDAKLYNLIDADQEAKLRNAQAHIRDLIEGGVPFWLIVVSALALGIGTMIGYEKIVKTLGEGMGDKHMSPAQGFAAQTSAVMSIGMADVGGMPVSTTHVLTSGVAGTVTANGDKLNGSTLGKIAMTWVTTLPGTVMVSFAMAIILHAALV